MAKPLFVVLTAGNDKLSLPQQNTDGTWVAGQWQSKEDYEKRSTTTRFGFWVTHEPAVHWRENSECYEVECEGPLRQAHRAFWSNKVRLLRKLTEKELVKYQVLSSGTHTIKDGDVVVTGSANVILYGKAKAEAYSATGRIEAHDRVEVRLNKGSRATVSAYGHSQVTADTRCVVIAYDEATTHVHGYGKFTVSLGGKSRLPKRLRKLPCVSAYNNARIDVREDADIRLASPKASTKIVISIPDYD